MTTLDSDKGEASLNSPLHVKYCNGKRWRTPASCFTMESLHTKSSSGEPFKFKIFGETGLIYEQWYCKGVSNQQSYLGCRHQEVRGTECVAGFIAALDYTRLSMEKDWLTLFGHREMCTYHVGIVKYCNGKRWRTPASCFTMESVHAKNSSGEPFNNGTVKGYNFGLLSWSHDFGVKGIFDKEVINGRTLVVDIKKCKELSVLSGLQLHWIIDHNSSRVWRCREDVSPMEKDWLTLFGHQEMRTYHVGIVRCKCDVDLKQNNSAHEVVSQIAKLLVKSTGGMVLIRKGGCKQVLSQTKHEKG
ncbi:hypothetical protein Sjap_026022 [Stephania japonica]|uniref:Uncharacterized protein n=1 Tax=Stephania japonica TaxID=461633 RepID=A0AAP0E2V1_9MAGN